MAQYDLTHARAHPSHVMAPGLFRALRRGERAKAKLRVVYDLRDDRTVRFWGPEPLGADDLRVLQGLIALAGLRESPRLPLAPETPMGQALREAMNIGDGRDFGEGLVVKSSYRALSREIGLRRNDVSRLRESIRRLAAVSIIVMVKGRGEQGFHLLSSYSAADPDAKDHNGGLVVAVNPLIAEAMLGANPQHVRIELSEVRKLRGEVARLIHTRLCGWIDPGAAGRIGLDALCEYAWPENDLVSARAKRMRRAKARKALDELARLPGWTVKEYVREKFAIRRPAVEGVPPNGSASAP